MNQTCMEKLDLDDRDFFFFFLGWWRTHFVFSQTCTRIHRFISFSRYIWKMVVMLHGYLVCFCFFLWLHYNGFIPSPHAFGGGLHHACLQWFGGFIPALNGPAMCPWSTPVPAFMIERTRMRIIIPAAQPMSFSFLTWRPFHPESSFFPFFFLLIFPGCFFLFIFCTLVFFKK